MTCLVTSAFDVGLPECSKSLNFWLCEYSHMDTRYPAKEQDVLEKLGDVGRWEGIRLQSNPLSRRR
jgi:hypothetical protein